MSFRGDDQRRYGSIPPVQYPVAGPQTSQSDVGRRLSFNTGDDGTYHGRPDRAPAFTNQPPSVPEDELFMTGSTTPAQAAGTSRMGSTNNALSGYQHQYRDPAPPTPSHSTYNPQNFAQATSFQRSPTTSLPYHPAPPTRYASTAGSYNPPTTTSYTPAAYNPAAYASATSPQRQATYHGYSPEQGYGFGSAAQSSYSHGQSAGANYQTGFGRTATSPALSAPYQPQPVPSPERSGYVTRSATHGMSQASTAHHTAYGMNGGISPGQPTQSAYPSASYPTSSQIPYSATYSAGDGAFYTNRHRSGSQTSPMASPRHHSSPSSPGLQRHPTNAPLPSRPVEEASSSTSWSTSGPLVDNEYSSHQRATQESIMEDIEAELNGGRRSAHSPAAQPSAPYPEDDSIQPQYPAEAEYHASSYRSSSNRTPNQQRYGENEAQWSAEYGNNTRSHAPYPSPFGDTAAAYSSAPSTGTQQYESDSDSQIGDGIDLGALSGGYAGNLTYDHNVGSPPESTSLQDDRRRSYQQRYPPSPHSGARAYNHAEMDFGGTGGLQSPSSHRLSFDEGEESVSVNSRLSGTESPLNDDYDGFFYHPGPSNRPLPALPPATSSDSSSILSVHNSTRSQYGHHSHSLSADTRPLLPDGPDAYYNSGPGVALQPERSVSMTSHSNTPQVQAPARARTDAEERKRLARHQQGASIPENDNKSPTSSNAFIEITLPSGRKRKLVPSKLTEEDFAPCTEPWAFSGIESWLRVVAEGDLDLKEKVVEDALIHLFTTKIPTMNVADAEALSSRIVNLMLESNVLVRDEEWVKLGDGHIRGVLWQLTGSGCYAPKLHDNDMSGRCYSHHCSRTLKKVDLDHLLPEGARPTDEWHVFYNLKKEDLETRPKKEVDRQNILHEIVTGEENYIKQLDVFRTLYRDDLRVKNPPVIQPNRREKFLGAVFGKLDTVIRVNKDHLLAQLKYRQQEQGPWIVGFSDLFREWIRKAKSDYIEYATGYPHAVYMVRRESDRNILFKRFLEDRQKHKSSLKQDWTHFLITPLQRLQRYILLLESVEQKMLGESEEKTNLSKAIEEIRVVVLECDEKVAETTRRVEMMELDRMLVLRPGFQSVLNLDHLGRKLLIQGDLQRLSSKGMRWVETHALLFDHYLILAKKEVYAKDGRGDRKYDVSREPIPMPLLFLESMSDEPVIKQKGITAPLARTTTAAASGTQLNRITTNGTARPGLEHSATNSSLGSGANLTQMNSNDIEGKILYPFKIKHLGHEVYTLYASSARDRTDWCNNIIEAKTRHAKALFSQNAEPFRLRVLADASFNYDTTSMHARSAGVPVKGTPLDRAIQDIEGALGSAQGIPPVCRAQVNCATGFTAYGKSVLAIGTDFGVFITEPSNPRGWTRTIQANRITQIAVLEEFAVCIVISDRSLICYSLDVVAPVSDFAPPSNTATRRAPQRLAKDVTYFATARMKDRMLVFYKRREGLHTSFKVLEPVLHKSSEKKGRLFGGRQPLSGATDTFRDFDEFFFPTDCYSLSLFQTYIAVATHKGIEMLTLDKKQPMSIPDLKAPAIANIASRIRDQRPLGMFKLNDNEFILTYEDCAVYVDRHGDVSRTLIMEYTGKQKKARGATMFGQYLLLYNEDYVEVRNAENGRLRQIIAGRDVRIIDFGMRGPTGTDAAATQQQQTYATNGQPISESNPSKGTVKIAMSHPELPGRQVVMEMVLNDGHAES